MKTIAIGKVGGVFKTRAYAKGNSVGEQGETEGILRHLMKRNDIRLVYFGKYYGDKITHELVEPCLDDLDEWCTKQQQEENWAKDTAAMKEFDPVAFIDIRGYAPTFSWIDNPRGAIIQCAPMRYTGPALNIMQSLGLPRYCINNDPRTYPVEQEMRYGWDHCIPKGILDQQDSSGSKRIGGVYWKYKTVHARAESWSHLPRYENTADRNRCVIAHAHIKDGCKIPARDGVWDRLLPDNIEVWGKGWQHFSGVDRIWYNGVLKPHEVIREFSATRYTPIVPAGRTFYTGKPWVAWSCGCAPVLYGKGEEFTWDPKGILLPLDSPARCTESKDLARAGYEATQLDWDDILKPDWSMLDRLVDDIVADRPVDWAGGYWQ